MPVVPVIIDVTFSPHALCFRAGFEMVKKHILSVCPVPHIHQCAELRFARPRMISSFESSLTSFACQAGVTKRDLVSK